MKTIIKNPLIRSASEIALMRRAGAACGKAIKAMHTAIQGGLYDTSELDDLARETLYQEGASPSFLGYQPPFGFLPYPATSCISINEEIVHGIPTRGRALKEGDLVTLDIGANVEGFHADTAFSLVVGSDVTDEQKLLLDATKNALRVAIMQVRPRKRLGDIGQVIYQSAVRSGLSVAEGLTGHFIGPKVHMDPSVPNIGLPSTGLILEPGMTFCIEPMFCYGNGNVKLLSDQWTVSTQDGGIAAHFEHTVVVTERGQAEILTLQR